MKTPALIVGVLLLAIGGAISAGLFSFTKTEKVADVGPVEVSKSEEKKAPLNLGWVLMGVGAVVVVIGATRRT